MITANATKLFCYKHTNLFQNYRIDVQDDFFKGLQYSSLGEEERMEDFLNEPGIKETKDVHNC